MHTRCSQRRGNCVAPSFLEYQMTWQRHSHNGLAGAACVVQRFGESVRRVDSAMGYMVSCIAVGTCRTKANWDYIRTELVQVENRKSGGKNEVKRVVNESCTLWPAQSQSICCVKEREKSGLEPKDWDNKLLTDPKNKDREGKSS